mgnify:CR=1 FL=1
MTDHPPSRRDIRQKHDGSLFADLLSTSHAIKHALSPVDLRPSFVSKLRDELNANVEEARGIFVRRQTRRTKIKWTAIGAGLAVYSVGLSLVFIRLARWVLGRLRNSTAAPHR